MLRTCGTCNEAKEFNTDPFLTSLKQKGFAGIHCYDCYKVTQKLASRKYLADPVNREKHRLRNEQYRQTEVGLRKSRQASLVSSLAYAKANKGAINAKNARYQMSKHQRIPAWANLDVIKLYYIYAGVLNMSVDHIVPLRGANVSGLHVDNNLQLLSKSDNSRKSNIFRGE